MTIAVDNAIYNKPMIERINSWLKSKKVLLQSGDLFHTRSTAHIIYPIVKNGLKVM